jgi:hypothetical protein
VEKTKEHFSEIDFEARKIIAKDKQVRLTIIELDLLFLSCRTRERDEALIPRETAALR